MPVFRLTNQLFPSVDYLFVFFSLFSFFWLAVIMWKGEGKPKENKKTREKKTSTVSINGLSH